MNDILKGYILGLKLANEDFHIDEHKDHLSILHPSHIVKYKITIRDHSIEFTISKFHQYGIETSCKILGYKDLQIIQKADERYLKVIIKNDDTKKIIRYLMNIDNFFYQVGMCMLALNA